VNTFEIEIEMRVISLSLVSYAQHPIIYLLILITTCKMPSPSRAVSRDGGISLLWNAQSSWIPSGFIVVLWCILAPRAPTANVTA
jgi:hypothetical protein